jgi:hypothetical protein
MNFLVFDHKTTDGKEVYRMIRGHLHGFLVMKESDSQIDLEEYIKSVENDEKKGSQ